MSDSIRGMHNPMLFNVIRSRLDPQIWILVNESHFTIVNCIEIIK